MSALRQAVDVVPDTRKCSRSSDAFVTPREQTVESTEQVSVSKSELTESTESETSTTSQPFPVQQDVNDFNINIRDYLIDRCVTDTNPTAAAADEDDVDGSDDNCDDIDGDIDVDDKIDKGRSFDAIELSHDLRERSVNPPPSIPTQRFSDSELVKRSYPVPTGTATYPGRSSSTTDAADFRVKRHRWKLFRKALNLFSFDESTAADDGAAGTARDDDAVGVAGADGTAGTVAADGGTATTARGNRLADDVDSHSDGGAGRSGEEQPPRLDERSVSVESLPGLVPARRQIPCHRYRRNRE